MAQDPEAPQNLAEGPQTAQTLPPGPLMPPEAVQTPQEPPKEEIAMAGNSSFSLRELIRDITDGFIGTEVAWDMRVRYFSSTYDIVTAEFPVWIYGDRRDFIRSRIESMAARNGLVVNDGSLLNMAYPEGAMCKRPDMILTGNFHDIYGTR